MQLKKLHAYFKSGDNSLNTQTVGFTAEINESDNVKDAVNVLRQQAMEAIGKTSSELYNYKLKLKSEIQELEYKLENKRKEWDAMAEFLKAQGIKPDATPMPQFQNLLTGTPDAEFVAVEEVEEYEEDEYEDTDEDDY